MSAGVRCGTGCVVDCGAGVGVGAGVLLVSSVSSVPYSPF